jgi:hypothetical protein
MATERSLKFDLNPLGDAFKRAYQADGGTISTTYGLYTFGDSTCDERTQAAIQQSRTVAEQASFGCKTDVDCQVSYIATRCSPGCGSPIASANVEHMQSVLTTIDTEVCGDFEAKGCRIAVPPCLPPPPLACIESRCVEVAP